MTNRPQPGLFDFDEEPGRASTLPTALPAPPGPFAADEAARTYAVDPRHNVVLEASAGTGKTTVLVQRYVNLLSAGVDPANILAITFTRKAAAEMRERIIDDAAPRRRRERRGADALAGAARSRRRHRHQHHRRVLLRAAARVPARGRPRPRLHRRRRDRVGAPRRGCHRSRHGALPRHRRLGSGGGAGAHADHAAAAARGAGAPGRPPPRRAVGPAPLHRARGRARRRRR